MIAVFKREARAYFQTVIGWLFIAALMAVYGLYFFVYNLNYGYPYITYSLSAISFILLLLVPILTMKSFSEERRNKTDQLILTAPISVYKIAAGKYLAMLAVFTANIVIIAASSLLLQFFGTVPTGENMAAVLGFWLYGAALIAVGMFISSLTENIVIAAVTSFGILLLSYMMKSICNLIDSNGSLLTEFLEIFDLHTPYSSFLNGCISISAVLYYLSVILLFIFLTVQSVQKRRWSMSIRKLSAGAYSAGSIAAAIAIAVVINLIGASLPETVSSIDCSSSKLYSLTEDTIDFVKQLDEDITIYVLSTKSNADAHIEETAERYAALSKHITVTYVDTANNPSFYKTYTDTVPTSSSLIVSGSQRSRVIDYYDIYIYEYNLDESTYSYSSKLTGYDAEGQISSAIKYVTLDISEMPVVYSITGHDEEEIGDGFEEALEKANITSGSIELMQEDAIPEDAAAIIINAPKKDFNQADAQKVIDYLQKGGKAILSVDYGYQDLPYYNSIMETYGITPNEGLVVENDDQYYYSGNQIYLLPNVDDTDYTASVYGSYIFAPYAVSLNYASALEMQKNAQVIVKGTESTEASEDSAEETGTEETGTEETGGTVETTGSFVFQALLETTDDAVVKKDPENADSYDYEEGDLQGTQVIAAAVQDKNTDTQLVVMGTSYLLGDDADAVVSSNNSSMFSDCISTMLGEVSLTASVIPVKNYTLDNLTIPTVASLAAGSVMIGVIPVILLLTGIAIWLIRRKE